MKRFALALTLVATLGFSTIAFAAPRFTNLNYTPIQLNAYDEQAAIENYSAAMEARKDYLKTLLDKGIITQSQYDYSVSNIQAQMDYVLENGLGFQGYGYGCGGFGGGCGGFGMGGFGGYYR